MNDPMLPLPDLSPVNGKRVEVRFGGGLLSSDGGVMALREVDKRLAVADRLAACLVDSRKGAQVTLSFVRHPPNVTMSDQTVRTALPWY